MVTRGQWRVIRHCRPRRKKELTREVRRLDCLYSRLRRATSRRSRRRKTLACTLPACGDGTTDTGEECDDGTAASDTTPDACRTDCTLPACGDGVTDTGEQCDYGTFNSNTLPGVCRTDCTLPVCGDGVTDSGEQCDDGNTSDGDGCDATCELQTCGDGIVNDGCGWKRVAKLVATDAAAGDQFGSSVSVSGDTAVVGGSGGDDSAFVFERNVGGADAWGQVAKLTASGADFGSSVSVSGDTVVVGARFENVAGVGSGSAYVFERNAGGVDAWGQVAKLTASDAAFNHRFGASVSVSGGTVVVGSERVTLGIGVSHSGSAYVFERDVGGVGAWGEVAKLTVSDGAFDDYFGWSVSIGGDTIVVGAHKDGVADARSGSAYVFERQRGGPHAWGRIAKLTASDAATGDIFGVSVSVSGDTIVVGASGNDDAGSSSGSAYVFERDVGGTDAWGEVAKLTASDAAAGDSFGWSSISGDTIVVGVSSDDDAGSRSGSAYLFKRNIGGADAWEQVAKLTVSDAASGDGFGGDVSVSGDTIMAGASGDDDAGSFSGSAYILTLRCEECDDGNTADGDGCSSTCQTDMNLNLIESGGFEQRGPWRFFTNGMGMFQVVGEEAVVTIGNSGSNTQFFQRFGGLVAGTYELDFDVKSSVVTRARTILVNETDLNWIAQAGFRARPAWSQLTAPWWFRPTSRRVGRPLVCRSI